MDKLEIGKEYTAITPGKQVTVVYGPDSAGYYSCVDADDCVHVYHGSNLREVAKKFPEPYAKAVRVPEGVQITVDNATAKLINCFVGSLSGRGRMDNYWASEFVMQLFNELHRVNGTDFRDNVRWSGIMKFQPIRIADFPEDWKE